MAAWWNVVLTLGEVFWSPRFSAWVASLTPTGREGLFLALASARSLLTPVLDVVLGHMNEELNPNCPACRDEYGHFCADALAARNRSGASAALGGLGCGTQHGSCPLPDGLGGWGGACPATCRGCPGWSIPGGGRTLWLALLCFSLSGPLLVWATLPFLRGDAELRQGCYGICSPRRFVPKAVGTPTMKTIAVERKAEGEPLP